MRRGKEVKIVAGAEKDIDTLKGRHEQETFNDNQIFCPKRRQTRIMSTLQ